MGYKTASPDRYGLLKEYARENRRNATLAEDVLWDYLRKGFGTNGYHVIRFSNEMILNEIETVLNEIEDYFNG